MALNLKWINQLPRYCSLFEPSDTTRTCKSPLLILKSQHLGDSLAGNRQDWPFRRLFQVLHKSAERIIGCKASDKVSLNSFA